MILKTKKLYAFIALEDFSSVEETAKNIFEEIKLCFFDKQIEEIAVVLLRYVTLPDQDFKYLLEIMEKSKLKLSNNLSKVLMIQFIIMNNLFTDGKLFLAKKAEDKIISFIDNIENNCINEIINFIEDDINFSLTIAITLKSHPSIRKTIIDNLPSEVQEQKHKALLQLYFDEENIPEAIKILQSINIETFNYTDCKSIFFAIRKYEIWDYEIPIIKILLTKENDKQELINLKLELFDVYLKLNQHKNAIKLGESLLEEDHIECFLDKNDKEAVIFNTILSCFERSKIDKSYIKKSKKILDTYKISKPSTKFKLLIEAEVYIKNAEYKNALKSVISAVKLKRNFLAKEYASLYYLSIKINSHLHISLESSDSIIENCFVKLEEKEHWYYIGNDNNYLDAIEIPKSNTKYQLFINKKINDTVKFGDKYSSFHEYKIKKIYSIEQYILWVITRSFYNLAKDGDLDGVQIIKVSEDNGETIDLTNLQNFLKELKGLGNEFFELYCKSQIPFSILATNEKGIIEAISRLKQEDKGFINCSNGSIEEFEAQKYIAKKIVSNKESFYIDATSAFFLIESGLLTKIYKHIPNIKIPHSIINFLGNISELTMYKQNENLRMHFYNNKIRINKLDQKELDLVHQKFALSIQKLESNPENIVSISQASKIDCFTEQKVFPELCDACILAQRDQLAILTDDYLYLTLNNFETQKESPEYFSSLALVRVLYEEKHISFYDYLDYFYYLSLNRVKFLFFNSEDLAKAVLGYTAFAKIDFTAIQKFNFKLTLSVDYGVSFDNAFEVIRSFVFKLIIDNTITSDIVERIFIETLNSLPDNFDKINFGKMLIKTCFNFSGNYEHIVFPTLKSIHAKKNSLNLALKIFE